MAIFQKIEKEGLSLPNAVVDRDGNNIEFKPEKIVSALESAFQNNGGIEEAEAEEIALETIRFLSISNIKLPTIDEIGEINVKILNDGGYKYTAKCYENYAQQRKNIRVMGDNNGRGSTDGFLMVSSVSKDTYSPLDKAKIRDSLIMEAEVDYKTAKMVAKNIEINLINSKSKDFSTELIRELAISELWKLGRFEAVSNYRNFSIPGKDLEDILSVKNAENSNIKANNPEAVNFTIAGRLSKEYALSKIFSKEVGEAHSKGEVHVHDLDMPWRVYCSAHSLEYLKKFGLELKNLQTSSSAPKHTETLTGHLNTFFAAMQAYYAGALGVGYFNLMYAPLIESDLNEKGKERVEALKEQLNSLRKNSKNKELEGILNEEETKLQEFEKNPISVLTNKEIDSFMKQRGQEAIYAASQNAFSRGGQTLFIDFNIHTGVPEYMKETLAVLPGGKYGIFRNGEQVFLEEEKLNEKMPSGYHLMQLKDPSTGKVLMKERRKKSEENGSVEVVQDWNLKEGEEAITYAHFDKTSKRFAKNLLDIYRKGDRDGQPFAFPKCDLHISKETFEDPEQEEILQQASEVASHNGSPYFIFDRDEVSLAACCRLRTAIEDNYVIKHPESMRFCGFQNVTVNLPQAAYRAARKGKKDLEGFLEEVDNTMDLAVKAHLQKKDFIKKMQVPGGPQWQTKDASLDGIPYIDLDKATYIIGMIGLNEVTQFLTGKELHELNNKEFKDYALGTIAHMHVRAKEYGEKYNLKFSLEETPAESATRRLSKTDLDKFPEETKSVVKGDVKRDNPYYSNSIHPRADAPIGLIERIELQGKFHPAIESGAITHAFVGEEKPSPESIYNLIKKTFDNTQTAQITISPEFTVCKSCHTTERGLQDECGNCGGEEELKHMTRVVGYYSFIEDWNSSKQEENKNRHKGNYSVLENKKKNKIPNLKNPHKGITAITIGKDNCPLCDDLQQAMAYRELVKGYDKEFNIVSYKANEEGGLVNAMLGNVNLSQLPALIILDENSNEIYRGQTIGSNGSTIPINQKEVEKNIKQYLETSK